MPYLTMREKSKATTKPWFSRPCDIQPGNGLGLFQDTTHTHIHLLTYFLRTHTGSLEGNFGRRLFGGYFPVGFFMGKYRREIL